MLRLLRFLKPDHYYKIIEDPILDEAKQKYTKKPTIISDGVWEKQIKLIIDSWEEYLMCLNRNDKNELRVKKIYTKI